jgi:hypothetical protein
MSETRGTNVIRTAVVLAAVLCTGLLATSWAGDGVYSSGMFELGDGQPPAGMPGMADISADPAQSGPDWAELFNADGSARDDYPFDAQGDPMGNGIPDYQELYGGQWAVFTTDYVSMGSDFEGDALMPDGRVFNSVVDADHDLGNAYVYETVDSTGNLVLFAAAERLGDGDSTLELEFNQDLFRLGRGGFGVGAPWKVNGARVSGDILVTMAFFDGALGDVAASVWTGSSWMPLANIVGEGCDASEFLCAISNAGVVDGGEWNGQAIEAGRFVELGLNVGALVSGAQPVFATVRLRTPQDAAFGYFGEGS